MEALTNILLHGGRSNSLQNGCFENITFLVETTSIFAKQYITKQINKETTAQ